MPKVNDATVTFGTEKKSRGNPLWRFIKRFVLICLLFILLVVSSGVIYYYSTLYTTGDKQKGYLALTNATVLVGNDLEAYEESTVLIQDGVITEIGRVGDVDIPASATIIDLNGDTLMPGLIDLHVHLGNPELEEEQELRPLTIIKLMSDYMRYAPDKRRNLLNHGVTTIRSVGDEHEWIMEVRRRVQEGELEGPRLYASGSLFTTLGGHPIASIGTDPSSGVVLFPDTPEEARSHVKDLAGGNEGVDLIKVVQERGSSEFPLDPIDSEVLHSIVAEAHAHNIPVFGHWGTLEDLEDLLAAGVDGLEHIGAGAVLNGWPESLLAEIIDRNITMTPTLMVEKRNAPPERQPLILERVGEFHAAGGRLVLGTDAGMPGILFGPSVHRELELLVESGLSPREALQTATSHAADALQIEDIGIIELGKAADLVVIAGDPLRRIEDIQNVVKVFRDGRLVVEH